MIYIGVVSRIHLITDVRRMRPIVSRTRESLIGLTRASSSGMTMIAVVHLVGAATGDGFIPCCRLVVAGSRVDGRIDVSANAFSGALIGISGLRIKQTHYRILSREPCRHLSVWPRRHCCLHARRQSS